MTSIPHLPGSKPVMVVTKPLRPVPTHNIGMRRLDHLKDKGQDTQTNAGNTISLGIVYDFVGTINGVVVPPYNFDLPVWKAIGNVRGYERVDYAADVGTVSMAQYKTYPLKIAFVPATIRPGLRPVFIDLTGMLVTPPAPFIAANEFSGMDPVIVTNTVLEEYGTDIGACFDEGEHIWKLGMLNANGGPTGLSLTWTVDSLSEHAGMVFVVQLGRVKTDDIDTGNEFWYDGPDYPYVKENLASNEKGVSLTHSDRPCFWINPDKARTPLTISYSANLRTYLLYQDDVEGSVPVLLEYPRTWGLSFEANYSPPAGPNDLGTIEFISRNLQPLGFLIDTELPVWEKNIITNKLDRLQVGKSVPMLLRDSPRDASRSVIIKFNNYSDAFLSRRDCHLGGGKWSDNLYPPEQIASSSSGSPITLIWASQSHGIMSGTEGFAIYAMQDGQTTVKVYWDNPIADSNTYRMSLDGLLKDQYACTYTGGDGDNATIEVYLQIK